MWMYVCAVCFVNIWYYQVCACFDALSTYIAYVPKNLNIRYLNCTSKVEMLSIHDIHKSRKCALNRLRFYFNFQLVYLVFFCFVFRLHYAVVGAAVAAALEGTHTRAQTQQNHPLPVTIIPRSDQHISKPIPIIFVYVTVDFRSIYVTAYDKNNNNTNNQMHDYTLRRWRWRWRNEDKRNLYLHY